MKKYWKTDFINFSFMIPLLLSKFLYFKILLAEKIIMAEYFDYGRYGFLCEKFTHNFLNL